MITVTLPQPILDWIKESLGSNPVIQSVIKLEGNTSSDLFRLEFTQDSHTPTLVLRLINNQEWLNQEPDLAHHEAAALKMAKSTGAPVPEFIAADLAGESCGYPSVLMTCLPGQVNLSPTDLDVWLLQQAEILLPIHSIDAADFQWNYFPYNKPNEVTPPLWSIKKQNWQKAIDLLAQPAPKIRYSFIHRDFHPMNTLWQGQSLCGVVDWVNACRGPSSFDLAWCRINLMQLFGVQTAERFLELYLSLSGTTGTYHPYWDLMAIIELLPDPPDVYEPWKTFGHTHLNREILASRCEEYLEKILEKMQ